MVPARDEAADEYWIRMSFQLHLMGCLGNLNGGDEFSDAALRNLIHGGDNARYAVLLNSLNVVNGIGPDRSARLHVCNLCRQGRFDWNAADEPPCMPEKKGQRPVRIHGRRHRKAKSLVAAGG